METLYRICPTCKGTGDQDTPDGPACGACTGLGFVEAYRPVGGAVGAQPSVNTPPPANRAVPQPYASQNAPQQQSQYQQQAQSYVPGNNNPGPSPRQMQFMEDLWKRIGWTPGQGDEHAMTMFGVPAPSLTRQQASAIIEDLKNRENLQKTAVAGTPVTGPGPDVPF